MPPSPPLLIALAEWGRTRPPPPPPPPPSPPHSRMGGWEDYVNGGGDDGDADDVNDLPVHVDIAAFGFSDRPGDQA